MTSLAQILGTFGQCPKSGIQGQPSESVEDQHRRLQSVECVPPHLKLLDLTHLEGGKGPWTPHPASGMVALLLLQQRFMLAGAHWCTIWKLRIRACSRASIADFLRHFGSLMLLKVRQRAASRKKNDAAQIKRCDKRKRHPETPNC